MRKAEPPSKSSSRRNPKSTLASRRDRPRSGNGELALHVLGKFREVFRAAKVHFGSVQKSVGVSGAQLWALWELHEQPGLRVSELAARLSLRQSTVSNLIEQLARAKHLTRERTDSDLRAVRLYLTTSGKRVVKTAPQPARGVLPDALESLKAKDLKELDAQLTELLRAMKVRAPGASKTHLEDI
jgi:MarR family transcriptional regulator, organic hydroperoxide resistance regulator